MSPAMWAEGGERWKPGNLTRAGSAGEAREARSSDPAISASRRPVTSVFHNVGPISYWPHVGYKCQLFA